MYRCSSNAQPSFLYGEDPHPLHPLAEVPLKPQMPQKHTQIEPRCFTCSHFEMCKYKKDYLKTVTLIQNSLGAPQRDYEITPDYLHIPEFVGFPFPLWGKYLPKEVIFNNAPNGIFFSARFNGINNVNLVYKSEKYFILLKLKYDEHTKSYQLISSKEAFYKVDYDLSKESLEEIQLMLIDWKAWIINTEAMLPPPKKDIINTTHFSGQLNCDMYDWNKTSYEDAVKKMIIKYPYGIPIDDNDKMLYHIATFHEECSEVPYAPLYFRTKSKSCSVPYIAPEKTKCSSPPKRRGDM